MTFLAYSVAASMAFACEYSVRDAGFVDIGPGRYRFYVYVSGNASGELGFTIGEATTVALLNSNVDAEMVDADHASGHAGMEYYQLWGLKSFPSAILVSPGGASLVQGISSDKSLTKERLQAALEKVVTSPKRREILGKIVEAYGIIVFVAGTDAAETRRAKAAVDGAMGAVARMMKQMPKPVDGPPCTVEIPAESRSEEEVLLWSLDVDRQNRKEPQAAVVYGKGRRLGPVLKGSEITKEAVTDILSVIGASCECGLDRAWMMGPMIPLAWGQELRSAAAKALGFDAESPMVRAEVGRILGMDGGLGPEGGTRRSSDPEGILGYREQVFAPEEEAVPAKPAGDRMPSPTVPISPSPGPSRPIRATFVTMGSLALLILACGGFVVLRARRKAA